MIRENRLPDRLVTAILYLTALAMSLLCLIPFLHVVSVSLSSRTAVMQMQVNIWPVGLNFDNYRFLTREAQVVQSTAISVGRVLIGVSLNLLITILTAYPLSRDSIRLPGRNLFKVLLLFGMLFHGGLIPTFLSMRYLGLYDNLAVLVMPPALNVFFIILMMNFFRAIPIEMTEAATIDGASHFDILTRIYLPVSLPSLATVALFSAVFHWNSWFDGLLYLRKVIYWPLQTYAYARVVQRQLESRASGGTELNPLFLQQLSPEGLVAAFIVLVALPIMLVYPFLQRYFLQGLTLGAVKG